MVQCNPCLFRIWTGRCSRTCSANSCYLQIVYAFAAHASMTLIPCRSKLAEVKNFITSNELTTSQSTVIIADTKDPGASVCQYTAFDLITSSLKSNTQAKSLSFLKRSNGKSCREHNARVLCDQNKPSALYL